MLEVLFPTAYALLCKLPNENVLHSAMHFGKSWLLKVGPVKVLNFGTSMRLLTYLTDLFLLSFLHIIGVLGFSSHMYVT